MKKFLHTIRFSLYGLFIGLITSLILTITGITISISWGLLGFMLLYPIAYMLDSKYVKDLTIDD